MKYIKKFELNRSPYFLDDEIKKFESLSRKLNYHINKYFGRNFVSVNWCDNVNTPIHVNFSCFDYNKDYSEQYSVEPYKMEVFKKVAEKIGVHKNYLKADSASFLLTVEQAEKLLSEAKLRFYDIEIEELTNKYNL